MFVILRFLWFISTISFTQSAFAIFQRADTLLPEKTVDLSIRFQHFEPFFPAQKLTASWAMDEGSGYKFLDASGNNHTAYITGYNWNFSDSGLTDSFRKTGKRAGGIFLNGTQWLQAKNSNELNISSSMTITLWLKSLSENAKENSVLISRQNSEGGYSLILGKKNNIIFNWIGKDGNLKSFQTAPLTISKKKWNHIGVTINQGKQRIIFFLNGELTAIKTNISFSEKAINEDLFIGARKNDSASCFLGFLDEISIYKKELSEKDLHAQYITGLPKIYTQTRATIDSSKIKWTRFKGNELIPHPYEKNTKLLIHFNGSLATKGGTKPINAGSKNTEYIPGFFGGALALQSSQSLVYPLQLTSKEGTFETWFINGKTDPKIRKVLFKIKGENNSCLIVSKQYNKWMVLLHNNDENLKIETKEFASVEGELTHLAITWQEEKINLWVNGVLQKSLPFKMPIFNGNLEVGDRAHVFTGYIDDIRISDIARTWGEICPTGYIDSESAALDLMDSFNENNEGALFRWTPFSSKGFWQYVREYKHLKNLNDGFLEQTNPKQLHAITHPDAFGFSSSIQTGIFFDRIQNGWAGVFTNAQKKSTLFSGITFSMNSKKSLLRIAVFKNGKISSEKTAAYDFSVKTKQLYTLTLSVYPDVIRGFIDGHNIIAMSRKGEVGKGYAGLLTINSAANFDDVHFTALTPSAKESRILQTRIFNDAPRNELQPSYKNFTYNAFRWKKRYGLLPWQLTGKNPEPPGNIFGPEKNVTRPNPVQSWRSEDSANSDIMVVNGKMYYSMRGNPDIGGAHGPAAIGMLRTTQTKFDGIHFNDLNADTLKNKLGLLRGHIINDSECNAPFPRDKRFQLNDQGMAYVNGKILIVVRESRNRIKEYPRFRRLVYGLYDIKKEQWVSNEPFLVDWSTMNPNDCYAKLKGLNGTPEIFNLKDPITNENIILLFYAREGNPMVAALKFDGENLKINPDLPKKISFVKADGDITYGQRIFFDNGIYYMNVNAGSNKEKLKKDWPDRFQLLTTLDPYNGPWIESKENTNKKRPYFSRGNEFDSDNAAIWQGTMFKFRNRYYMYYENYHSIKNRDKPYELYNHLHSGSRVGFSTAN